MEIVDQAKKPKRHSRATSIKDRFLEQIEQLASVLPLNAIDQLIDELGGPTRVAEISGRRGRFVREKNGQVCYINDDSFDFFPPENLLQVQYKSRSEERTSLEMINIREKLRFMNGEKLIVIISGTASTGVSLHVSII